MNTPKTKPNFFYRALAFGALFALTRADIVSAATQTPTAASTATASLPITSTVSAPVTTSTLSNPVIFAQLQPANGNTASVGNQTASTKASDNSAPKNSNSPQQAQSSGNSQPEQRPNDQNDQNRPNFEGRFERGRFDRNDNQAPFWPQNQARGNTSDDKGFPNQRFNESLIDARPLNNGTRPNQPLSNLTLPSNDRPQQNDRQDRQPQRQS